MGIENTDTDGLVHAILTARSDQWGWPNSRGHSSGRTRRIGRLCAYAFCCHARAFETNEARQERLPRQSKALL